MKYLLTVLLAGLAQAACSQSYPDELVSYRASVNYADHSIIFFVRPLKTEIIPYPKRRYYWYSNNNVRSTQGGYSGKLLNGPYTDFYKNKQLKEQGNFRAGLKTDMWRSWSESGMLKEDSWWKKGVLNGPFLKYDHSGRLAERANYRHGMLHGKQVIYENTDSSMVFHYKHGKKYTPKAIMPSFLRKLFKKNDQGTEKPEPNQS